MKPWFPLLSLLLCAAPALASEAQIRKALAERLPDFPKIDEVRPSPIAGLFEVRVGRDIFYSDAKGEFLLQDAQLIDVKTRRNLTEERLEQLSAVPFDSLPFKDALVWKRGKGERRMAVFADPNCGYCKRLERTLQQVDNVTVYTFLIPILGPDSRDKSKAIWCAKDANGVWLDWMLRNKAPAAAPAGCDDAALARNRQLADRLRVQGTPAIFFEDGRRAPGALDQEVLEQRLKRAEGKG